MDNGNTPGRQLSRYNTRRSSTSSAHKPYEHMLLKELPGVKRSNAPMHAVLESALEDSSYNGMHEAQKVRNHALIHYLASLANSNNNDDIFDFDFVQSLILNGADVNCTDRNGQTIFHEVARSWNLDVALFLLENGADINQQDKFGRSPLHVAAAVDYADMVRFLVKHKADIDITTFGEQQMPIHYAAKNDACRSLKMLLGYGANIDSRDSKNRTPLQVAAEMNRAKSAKLLVQHGAPAGVHDNVGNSALSLLIEKLPDVAIEALDQFHSVSTINRKEFFFLNYLEGNRLLNPKSPAYSALEIAVHNHEFDIILHPVMKRFIDVKWQQFGRNGAVTNLCLNLFYAILWTVLAVTSPTEGDQLYLPWSRKAWRLVISVVVCLMTINEIRKQITGTIRTRNHQKKWISWRASELEEDLQYCHPRWPQEEMYLKSEIKAIRDTPLISSSDSWIYFDWFSLFLILGTIASHVVFFNIDNDISQVVYARFITMLLLVLWLRIMQYARPFEGAGPFVAIFGHISKDIINWGTLTLLITIPYACAFWITFGEGSRNPVESYSDVSSLLYELFSMIVVNDHDFEALQAADATMARILCGSYIALMAIINLNILIALLSDTFTRVYGNAVANAVMQRAKTILFLEKSLSKKGRRAYEEFIKNSGSPETVDLERDISANNDRDEQKASDLLQESVQEIHELIHERFGKNYGEGKKSDLDHIKEHLEKINKGSVTQRGKCGCREIQRKVDVIQKMLVKLSTALKVDISELDNNLQNSDDDDDDDDGDDDTLVGQIDEEEEAIQTCERKEKNKWDYEKGNEVKALYMRGYSPEQWTVNKAALNYGYHFEEGKSAIAQKARDSIRSRETPIIRGSVDHGQSDGGKRESVDIGQTDRRKLAGINASGSIRDEEFISEFASEPGMIPYTQVRDVADGYSSRAKRRQLRTEVYQKRLRARDEQSTNEKRRGSYFSPNNGTHVKRDRSPQRILKRDRSPQSSPDKINPRGQVRRSESMPSAVLGDNLPHRRPKESYYYNIERRNSPRSLNTELFTRQMAERKRDRKENIPRRKRSPDRRSQFDDKSRSGSLKHRGNKQRPPSITVTYPDDRFRQASDSDEYYKETQRDPPDETRRGTDSEATESEHEENQAGTYSDNDVIQKRARSFREKRYLEDWDNRSVKSVAF